MPLWLSRRTEAHDLQSLLFSFLDELLFVFSTEFFVVRELQLGAIDREKWTIEVTGCAGQGESSVLADCREQAGQPLRAREARAGHGGACFLPLQLSASADTGGQIKAITYSAMQIHEREEGAAKRAEVFVIVDI